ncbi:MAG: hypothetical protein RIR70_1339 [Pseudomonadota bacterium]|jgi:RNA polymerase sigma-54 factor
MKQTLNIKLSQHLALTPQLQQAIRLLQLSTIELNQEIDKVLFENPLLERDDVDAASGANDSASMMPFAERASTERTQEAPTQTEPASEQADTAPLDWGQDHPRGAASGADEDNDYQDIQAASTSLRDHLIVQLAMTHLGDRDRSLTRMLIEALDDDGYLTQPLDEIFAMLIEGETLPDLEIEDLQIALKHLQNMDPPGVGARTASECLELQLRNMPPTPDRDLALKIVMRHIDQLAARDYTRLRRALACDDEALREACALIRSLNPRPGAPFAPLDTRYIVPDVLVRKVRNRWTVSLNPDAMPRLKVNRMYADILQRERGNAAGMATQLQEAKWLIKNVQQRFDTILRVSQAIVDRQKTFFDFGEVAMHPLTLREIADTLGLHESTVSRVTTQKYLASPRGIFELKYFFGSHVSTEAGGECSATAIRALIKQLVGAEDTKSPLSDSRIAEMLGQQGIVVARRTIAKYRESLNIPPVNLRRAL